MTFLGQKLFLAYQIALLQRKNILFTELKNLFRSSNGGRRRKRRRSQFSAFVIQIIWEKRDPGHTFLAFFEVKIFLKYIIVVKFLDNKLLLTLFQPFLGEKASNILNFHLKRRNFTDFRVVLTLRAFFSVPDCADGKSIFFYNFGPIELILFLNERY